MDQKAWETGVHGNAGLSYNIQVRQTLDGSWQQRHIWHADDRFGDYDPPKVDGWIRSFAHSERDLAHMYEIEFPS